MSLSESMEMYLETIYLLEREHGHAHVAQIAKELRVTKPSVTKATNNLKDEGYIKKETYGNINLTEKGTKASKKIYIRHSYISRFLEESLELSPDEAEENACRMEHIITETMLDAISEYLNKNNS